MNSDLQEKILNLWISDEETIRIVNKVGVSTAQFKKIFASKILQYLLDVYDKKTKLGDCPVIYAMLTMFKRHDLSITEMHHICDTFKLHLTITLIDENQKELAIKLLKILRENFKGVLKSFMEIQYNIHIGAINIINEDNYLTGSACSTQADLQLLDKSTQDKEDISLETSHNSTEESDYVKNYVNTTETEEEFNMLQDVLKGEVLDDFNETNENFFNLAVLEDTYTEKYHELLSSSIDIYISIFLDLLFFNKITTALNDLKYLIADPTVYSDEQLLIMKELTESLMFNLIKWKEEIIDNHNKAIHYYDDAILGDIEQLKVMLSPQNDDETNDLDDIFDF